MRMGRLGPEWDGLLLLFSVLYRTGGCAHLRGLSRLELKNVCK